jgi:hypothetical protein
MVQGSLDWLRASSCRVRYQAHCGPAVSRVRWRELARADLDFCCCLPLLRQGTLIARSCSSARRATGRTAEVLASPGLREFLGGARGRGDVRRLARPGRKMVVAGEARAAGKGGDRQRGRGRAVRHAWRQACAAGDHDGVPRRIAPRPALGTGRFLITLINRAGLIGCVLLAGRGARSR